jgi:hypothetical protein
MHYELTMQWYQHGMLYEYVNIVNISILKHFHQQPSLNLN